MSSCGRINLGIRGGRRRSCNEWQQCLGPFDEDGELRHEHCIHLQHLVLRTLKDSAYQSLSPTIRCKALVMLEDLLPYKAKNEAAKKLGNLLHPLGGEHVGWELYWEAGVTPTVRICNWKRYHERMTGSPAKG